MFSRCGIFLFGVLALGPRVVQCREQSQQKVIDAFAPFEERLAGLGEDANTVGLGCRSACALLSSLLPGEATSRGVAGYQPLAYWSAQQTELTPACRIDVVSAESIATTIKVSRFTKCPFSVRSGGHAAWAGGSSIQDGILINMKALNMVELSEDRSATSVGPGNTWHDVYTKLDPLGVSVVGGREAGVGVGGLVLGGGISYFSGRYGWACDNVRNYEVVLADGRIVNASPLSHPDLYWALRGGASTNLGIVTRFDLATFEQGLLWGGSRYYSMSTNASLATAFSNFNDAAPSDPYAHLYVAFVHAQGDYLAVSGPVYGKPVANAPIFAELDAIPSLVDATSVTTMATLAVELNQTAYLRQTFRTFTFHTSAPLLEAIIALFVAEIDPLIAAGIPGLLPAFAFQPLSDNILAPMSSNGGNALGLSPSSSSSPPSSPLTILTLNIGWSSATDDTTIHAAATRFLSSARALAREMRLSHDFIYMNYASPATAAADQQDDVYAGYGEQNVKRLRSVRDEYDPQNVFAELWSGGWKL